MKRNPGQMGTGIGTTQPEPQPNQHTSCGVVLNQAYAFSSTTAGRLGMCSSFRTRRSSGRRAALLKSGSLRSSSFTAYSMITMSASSGTWRRKQAHM